MTNKLKPEDKMNPPSKKPAIEFYCHELDFLKLDDFPYARVTLHKTRQHEGVVLFRQVLPDQDDEVRLLKAELISARLASNGWQKDCEERDLKIQSLTEENDNIENTMLILGKDNEGLHRELTRITALLRECEGALEKIEDEQTELDLATYPQTSWHRIAEDMLTKIRASNLHDTMGDKKDE